VTIKQKEEPMANDDLFEPARRQFALSGLALGAAALLPTMAAAQTATPAPAQGASPVVQAGLSPRLTVHAIDIYNGSAGAGMRIDFSKKEGDVYKLVRTVITNGTGRSDEPLLIGESYQPGDYELLMHFDEYFARKEAKLPAPPFLSKVPIRIRVSDITQRIHLPIQFGPWSYTYSRGS
jgi:5-hydroxyisourate hydrolase